MALLPPEHVAALTEMFETLQRDVKLVHYTQKPTKLVLPEALQCTTCKDTGELLDELAALSDHLSVETHDFQEEVDAARAAGVDKIPAVVIDSDLTGGRVRYFGMPAGYEFASFIEDIVDAGGPGVDVDDATATSLASLGDDVHMQVFASPTCPYCPVAVRTAHKLAMVSDRVTADCVVAGEFPHLAQKYAVMAVPKTVVNETVSFEGALPEADVVAKVVEAAAGPA
jgi:glutaredoxin-like protein